MAMPAENLETDVERIVRLESHVEHIQSDITEVKADISRLDQRIEQLECKIDQRFEKVDERLEKLDQKIDQKTDSLKDALFEFRFSTQRTFTKFAYWGFSLYVVLAAGLLGVMAKGFGWIR